MKQVFLSGQGQIALLDAPIPQRINQGILVRNAFSLISAGTEGAAITQHAGARGLYEKAMQSRDRLDHVWHMVQTQGLSNTMALVQNKLADYNPIGYSCAGQVLETDSDDLGFQAGQRVACMGTGFANHAEFVVAPKNLTVALPDQVSYEEAAFAAIACIAMQGIRRLELSPGETVAVVGLGLIGQVALRLASVMGYRSYGIDIDTQRVAHAATHSNARGVINAQQQDVVSAVHEATAGHGIDGVVICAAGKVDTIINQAFDLCRPRGRISVVGDIGLGLQRAKMYAKELEVRLSCSYGVGRYDPTYELDGIDYPLAHVRWTERRNLALFLQWLAEKRLSVTDLVSACNSIDKANDAYQLIKSDNTDIYGVLLDYALPAQPALPEQAHLVRYPVEPTAKDSLHIGLIGIGAYAKNIHLPNLIQHPNATIQAIASRSGSSAAVAAKKARAAYATSDAAALLADDAIDAVVISTRHATHQRFVLDALAAGKHVFVEKPMAISIAGCREIMVAQQQTKKIVRVGHNRRFAPLLIAMKQAIGDGKKLFNIRVNVGNIGQHWSNTAHEGGRLLGEGVHFFDLATWMMDSTPMTVAAQFIGTPDTLNPDVSVSIHYNSGSVANVIYTSIGHTAQGKEFFELFGNGRSALVNDYKKLRVHGSKQKAPRHAHNNKGQADTLNEFITAVRTGNASNGADAQAGLWATAIAEAALASAQRQVIINLSDFIASA